MQLATNYCRVLFTVEPSIDSTFRARRTVFHAMTHSVTPSMHLVLDSPFTETELQRVVSAIDGFSCPRDDGLTKFFFPGFWPLQCALALGYLAYL